MSMAKNDTLAEMEIAASCNPEASGNDTAAARSHLDTHLANTSDPASPVPPRPSGDTQKKMKTLRTERQRKLVCCQQVDGKYKVHGDAPRTDANLPTRTPTWQSYLLTSLPTSSPLAVSPPQILVYKKKKVLVYTGKRDAHHYVKHVNTWLSLPLWSQGFLSIQG